MGDNKQLDLGIIVPGFRRKEIYHARRERLITHARYIIGHHGHDVALRMLRTKADRRARSSLSKAIKPRLEDRDRHHLYLDDLPWLVDADPSQSFPNLIATLDQDELEPEETVVCMVEAALRLHGRKGVQELERETNEVAEERRRRKVR